MTFALVIQARRSLSHADQEKMLHPEAHKKIRRSLGRAWIRDRQTIIAVWGELHLRHHLSTARWKRRTKTNQ